MNSYLNSIETTFLADRLALRPGQEPDTEQSEQEASFVKTLLNPVPSARLLDAPCGTGRHSLPLAQAGFAMTSIDGDPQAIAKARAVLRGCRSTLRLADLFGPDRLSPDDFFDGAFSLYSCLGYTCDREDDRRFLANLHSGLKPGGGLVLGTANRRAVFAMGSTKTSFTSGTHQIERRDKPLVCTSILERHFVLRPTNLSEKALTREETTFTQRRLLYDNEEMAALLQMTGFRLDLTLKPFRAERGNPDRDPHLVYVASRI